MPYYSSQWTRLAKQYKRDAIDPRCWLCQGFIDKLLPHNDPWSFTADHIVPRAMGGEDTKDNMAPAHRACNTMRSNNLDPNNWYVKTSVDW